MVEEEKVCYKGVLHALHCEDNFADHAAVQTVGLLVAVTLIRNDIFRYLDLLAVVAFHVFLVKNVQLARAWKHTVHKLLKLILFYLDRTGNI